MIVGNGSEQVDVKKSTGRLLTLMLGTGLPLLRYQHGRIVIFTIAPLGPLPGCLFDWRRSSSVIFNERTVQNALDEGYLLAGCGEFELSSKGESVAERCRGVFGPVIDDHFKGRGIDWRDLGKRNG